MLCPYCLTANQTFSPICSQCKQSIPSAYVQTQGAKSARPPVIISIVGFSGHGKTVYLASLFHSLEHLLPKYWPEFSPLALDQETLTNLEEKHLLLRKGRLPESTRLNFPKPSIHRLSGIPQYGDRTLLLYDPPGEAFNLDEGIGQYAGFVKRSNCVLFLISLPDLDHPVADGMFKLLNTYILGMSRLDVPEQEQHLIVVYTKADEIIEQINSLELQQYLRQQGTDKLSDLKEYLRGMEGASKLLAQYTADILEAHRFLNQARRYFKSVSFTAVSALGSQPRNGALEERIAPRRVIDPLLWVLSKSPSVLSEYTSSTTNKSITTDLHLPQNGAGSSGKWLAITLGILLCIVIGVWLYSRSSVPTQALPFAPSPVRETPVRETPMRQPPSNTAIVSSEARFIGTIDNRFHIEMNLRQSGNTLSGSLVTSFGENNTIRGTIDENGNFIISEFDGSGEKKGVFRGMRSSSTLNGVWSLPNGSRQKPFVMRKE